MLGATRPGGREALRDDFLVRLVSAYGPRNLSKIARRLGVSRETVVRAYARLGAEGLGPRPNIRMEKLGLGRFMAFAKPGREGRQQQLDSLFNLMGDYAYLEHYQKLDPYNVYLLIFTIPPELLPRLGDFLNMAEDGSILHAGRPVPLSWVRYHSIRAPWKNVGSLEQVTSGPLTYVPEGETEIGRPKLDYGELLVLSALQAGPNANLAGLVKTVTKWAENGYEGPKDCVSDPSYDWNRRLRGAMRFVDSFPMHLSRGEPDLTRRKRHHWASFTLWWEGLGRNEITRSAMASTSIPYLRTDGASVESGSYFSIFSAPSGLIPGYLDFLSHNAPEGMNVAFPSLFSNFSLPFPSFSLEEGHWTWQKERTQSLLTTLQTA